MSFWRLPRLAVLVQICQGWGRCDWFPLWTGSRCIPVLPWTGSALYWFRYGLVPWGFKCGRAQTRPLPSALLGLCLWLQRPWDWLPSIPSVCHRPHGPWNVGRATATASLIPGQAHVLSDPLATDFSDSLSLRSSRVISQALGHCWRLWDVQA